MNPDFWNNRYTGEDFVFGTAPNDFLRQHAGHLPAGPVLCLGEGEGRNAAFLAGRGHAVTAVDQSAVGLDKARRLAADREVALTTVVADLADYPIAPGAWAGIVSIFLHLPPPLRRRLFAAAAVGLQPGGVLILEAYTPDQVHHRTGGPVNAPEMFMTRAQLQEDLAGLELEIARELERDVVEGSAHTGHAAVVQILARRR
ncbi:MAG: class I SAM-dependent methyltransferase [Opitutales bacterium]|nr:class I SAM-dependent methyltransferase [Opitutales bacterium]